jgi:hypothetical protein
MLIDPAYRRWVVKQVRDPFIKQFWEMEFESWDPRFMREAVAPIQIATPSPALSESTEPKN